MIIVHNTIFLSFSKTNHFNFSPGILGLYSVIDNAVYCFAVQTSLGKQILLKFYFE